MDMLAYLIPVALLLGGIGLAAFLWSLRSGQYDDLDGAANRILFEEDSRAPEAARRVERRQGVARGASEAGAGDQPPGARSEGPTSAR